MVQGSAPLYPGGPGRVLPAQGALVPSRQVGGLQPRDMAGEGLRVPPLRPPCPQPSPCVSIGLRAERSPPGGVWKVSCLVKTLLLD